MTSVRFDSPLSEEARRHALYDGEIFVFSPRAGGLSLCEIARELSEEAFHPYAPQDAQWKLQPEEYTEVLRQLKPKFIHDPRCKKQIRLLMEELGCDLKQEHFDVPRLRTSTSDGYLTSGLAYAFKPHRDTWYSPPMCQLNWWLPVYPIEPSNTMAFHLNYWATPIKNTSADFNYQDWVVGGRKQAGQQGKVDNRRQSEAIEPLDLEPDLRIVCEPGALVIFSAAHLHSTVPNTTGRTRFSIDFRSVHMRDLIDQRGAPNIDSQCTGTTIRDYLRAEDCKQLPDEVCRYYETHDTTADVLAVHS